MVRRCLGSFGALAALVAALGLAVPVGLAGQSAATASAAPKRFHPPRTPWGDPDLQGIWPGTAMMGVPQERPRQLGERAVITDEEFLQRQAQVQRQDQAEREQFVPPSASAGAGGGAGGPGHWIEHGRPQRQASLVIDPADGRIPPMTAAGQQRTAAISPTLYYDNNGALPTDGPEDLSVYDRCITRGVVGSMLPVGYNAGNEIVQGPGYVVLRNEMIHEARVIPLDGRPHLPMAIRSYMGDSRGRWDGETLVVDTTNFNGLTGVGANGRAIYHSDALHLVERFTRVSSDTIEYEVVVSDPNIWTRPWTMRFPLAREPDYGMFEYACHEGNYGLRNILSASRAGEQSARPADAARSSR